MLKEKNIYNAWKKRFGYPSSPLETQAVKAFQRVRKLSSLSKADVLRKFSSYPLIAVGDDAAIGMQQEILVHFLFSKLRKKKTLVITNRNDVPVLSILKRKKISMQRILDGDVNAQTQKMYKIAQENKNKYDHIVIWTGHLRLSSNMFQKKFPNSETLYIYLQCNELHWKFPLASGWKQLNKNQMVWMDGSPLISIDHYRSSEEKDFILIRPEMLQSIFIQIMNLIRKKMSQKRTGNPKKILHVFDSKNLKMISKIKNSKIRRFINDRVMNGESAVVPKERLVLLSTLNSSHIAEEAAHYLRTASRTSMNYGPAMTVIEEALAFFASLLLFPNRRIPTLGRVKNMWDEVHAGGYTLGFQLWKKWNRSKKSRPMIKKLWKLYPNNELEAQMMFRVMTDLK